MKMRLHARNEKARQVLAEARTLEPMCYDYKFSADNSDVVSDDGGINQLIAWADTEVKLTGTWWDLYIGELFLTWDW